MAENAKTRIILRNGTAARWATKNPVLLPGESGIETDTKRQKYGDGVTPWNELEYAAGSRPTAPTAWGEIVGTLMAQMDLKAILDAKEAAANRGKNGGYAPLNEEGVIPSNHLPNIFYKGMVMMWSGKLVDIPDGWGLCDGQDGRPNLLGRFPRCVGSGSAQPGTTGGANSVTLQVGHLPSHTHTLPGHTHSVGSHYHGLSSGTAASASHNHGPYRSGNFMYNYVITGGTNMNIPTGSGQTIPYMTTTGYTGDGAHTHTLSGTTDSAGSATTTSGGSGSTGAAGLGNAFNILPLYYDLAFIIKL